MVLSQGSQGAAGRAERSAAWVGEGSAPDRVVLEGTCLAARTEVRVGRRFHGRHAGVIGVQVRVIHLIHGDQPVRAPVCCRDTEGGNFGKRRFLVCLQSPFVVIMESNGYSSNQSEVVCLPSTLQELLAGLSKTTVSFVAGRFGTCGCFFVSS